MSISSAAEDGAPAVSAESIARRLKLCASCITPSQAAGCFSERFEVKPSSDQLLFAKVLPNDPELLDICTQIGLFQKEQRFYAALDDLKATKLENVGPALHLPKLHHSSPGLLVMEHLVYTGFVPVTPSQLLTVSQMRLALEALAEFHAWLPPELSDLPPRHEWSQYGTSVAPLVESGISSLRQSGKLAPAVVEALELGGIVQTLMTPVQEPIVMCHGDCWAANLLLKPDGSQAALIDFQFVGPSCAADDVVVLLLTGLPGAVRRRHENELRMHYARCYASARQKYHPECERTPAFEDFCDDHLRHGASLAAVVLLSDLSIFPDELSIAALEDIAAMIGASAVCKGPDIDDMSARPCQSELGAEATGCCTAASLGD